MGLTLEEVAAACDCSLATAKRRIARAQREIREHLGDSARTLVVEAGEPVTAPDAKPKRRARGTEEVANDD